MLYSRVTGSRVSRLRFVLGILNCRALVSVQDPPKMSASDITPLLDLGYSNCRRVSRKRVGRWLLLDDSLYRLDKMNECCQSSQRVTTNCCCCCCRSGCQSSQRVTAAGGRSAENANPSHPCLPARGRSRTLVVPGLSPHRCACLYACPVVHICGLLSSSSPTGARTLRPDMRKRNAPLGAP